MAKIEALTVTLRVKRSPAFWCVFGVLRCAVCLRLISMKRAGQILARLVVVSVD
jgi:hypothetical protein